MVCIGDFIEEVLLRDRNISVLPRLISYDGKFWKFFLVAVIYRRR